MRGKAKSLMPFDRCPVDGGMPSPTHCKSCEEFRGNRTVEHNQMPYTAILCNHKPSPELQDIHVRILKMCAGIKPYSQRYSYKEIAYTLNVCPATITYHKNRAIEILLNRQGVQQSQIKSKTSLIKAIKKYYNEVITVAPAAVKTTDERIYEIANMISNVERRVDQINECFKNIVSKDSK